MLIIINQKSICFLSISTTSIYKLMLLYFFTTPSIVYYVLYEVVYIFYFVCSQRHDEFYLMTD